MKQTAVEWVLFELSKNGLLPDGIPSDIHNQAKEIFEKQIINAYNQGVYLAMKPSKRAEDYYEKTFKSK